MPTNKSDMQNELMREVKSIAEEAGRSIATIYRSGDWNLTEKADFSPVTQADLAAHDIIVAGLRKLTNDPIVSEEDKIPQKDVGRNFWLIDPLDGTRDFVARLDTFAVCIARLENYVPILGVIHAPITKETWWAETGRGAYGPSGNRIVNDRRNLDLVATGSRSAPSEKMNKFYEHFKIKETIRMGSAIKFCKLAEGQFDLYPRFGATSEWDTAAAQIILEEADCKLIDIRSRLPMKYGKPEFANHGFVASRNDLDIVGELYNKGLIS
jgi:3'(2'), 5'-bisphosphate nucleotidase